jgi:hypothetical protein
MNSRKSAIIVGVLFIAATASYMLGNGYLEPILTDPDWLINVSTNKNTVLLGMLLELVNCIAVVGISLVIYPTLKKYNETLAKGYIGFRVIESLIVILGSISLLSLLSLSQEFISSGTLDASYYLAKSTEILARRDMTVLFGINLVFPIDALILNYLLFQSKLVPRWISGLGIVGALLMYVRVAGFVAGFWEIFGTNQVAVLALPIWVQEMVFAVWLIVKGFNTTFTLKE